MQGRCGGSLPPPLPPSVSHPRRESTPHAAWRVAGGRAQALDRARPALQSVDLIWADGRGRGAGVRDGVRDGMRNEDKRVVRNHKQRFESTVQGNN